MKNEQTKNMPPSLKLSWGEVAYYAEQLILKVLKRKINIKCLVEDRDFWAITSVNTRFTIDEIFTLLKYADVTDKQIIRDTMPEDMKSSKTLGEDLSKALLKKIICSSWEAQCTFADYLWLLGVDDSATLPKIDENIRFIGSMIIDSRKLWSKNEVIEKLTKSYAIYSDLTELCDRYVKEFGNELYWHYPISDGKHNGVYFLVVKEGVLCLPYNEVTEEDNVRFITDEAKLCDAQSMMYFIKDFEDYAEDLSSSLHNLKGLIKELEASIGKEGAEA